MFNGNIGLTLNIGESEGFSDETDVDVTFSLTPGVTYMLTDNWYIGGELGVSVGPGTTSTFTLGPSGGYYVPFNKTIGMMNTVGMGFGAVDKDFAFSFGYVPGLIFSVSDKVYLSTSFGSGILLCVLTNCTIFRPMVPERVANVYPSSLRYPRTVPLETFT